MQQSLVSGDKKKFLGNLQLWLLLAIPATSINALIRALQSRIALSFRTSLTENILQKYLQKDVFYKLAQLDSRIQNADQLITVDVERFSTSLSELYSNLAKPMLDLVLFGTQLALAVGWIGPTLMGGFYVVCISGFDTIPISIPIPIPIPWTSCMACVFPSSLRHSVVLQQKRVVSRDNIASVTLVSSRMPKRSRSTKARTLRKSHFSLDIILWFIIFKTLFFGEYRLESWKAYVLR